MSAKVSLTIGRFCFFRSRWIQELEAFLKTSDSTTAGWSKGDSSGETIGHDSGRKIVDILKRNPNKVKRPQYTAHLFTVLRFLRRRDWFADSPRSTEALTTPRRTLAGTPTRTNSTCAKLSRIASAI